jgi:aspartyl-tRNA synthetase
MGGMTFVDLRDRYGITQLVFNDETDKDLNEQARQLGREFVVQIQGSVAERSSKNPNIPTGEIEILVTELKILNAAQTPPFTIETETDGGEELRMQYRYLDLRRVPLQENLRLRHKVAMETRVYLNSQEFIEVETPVLIKSTPEGARDFVVPSRMNEGEFYALPQSPQTFKQLLMVSGYDKYFQIVRCFRDEDLRADRQPEFTQIDCELSFVERDDVLATFEGLTKHLFKTIRDIDLPDFPIMPYEDAMRDYGSDKPDTRFDMKLFNLNELAQGKGFNVFDQVESVLGICATGCAEYTRKQLDELTEWVKRPQIGMKGLVWVKWTSEGLKSSVDKFYSEDDLKSWAELMGAQEGDLLLVLAGDDKLTRFAASELRLEMGDRLELRDKDSFHPLWVVDFPLVEWDEESNRFHAMHHPFTSPLEADKDKLASDPGSVSADAYDLVINGVEIGGGSIRIHERELQQQMFDALGFTKEEAEAQFGFLLGAFEYGAPPHGGIAFGFDRLCALLGGADVIRDYIAFPKNNAGRDVMLDAPSAIDAEQLKELKLKLDS